MIEHWSFLCSPAYSYQINYKIQSAMYSWLDKNTEETLWLRAPGIAIWWTSCALSVVMRVCAVVEVFFKGLCLLITSPFTSNPIIRAKAGLHEIFVHTPKNILRVIYITVELTIGTIEVLVEPKMFTMEISVCMEFNLYYARAGTLHSEKHEKDLGCVEGIVKPKFMAYQDRIRGWDPDPYLDSESYLKPKPEIRGTRHLGLDSGLASPDLPQSLPYYPDYPNLIPFVFIDESVEEMARVTKSFRQDEV